MPEVKFTSLLQRQLHHFADASSKAYGIISYPRVVSPDDSIFLQFCFGKSTTGSFEVCIDPEAGIGCSDFVSQSRHGTASGIV